MDFETLAKVTVHDRKMSTERGPDIVRMPSMGQKRTISGMRTISEGHKIPMVVMLFITP